MKIQVIIYIIIIAMQASLQEKQKYLRIQILEAAYDPEDFIEFMNNNSAIQSPSIQNLSMGQLKMVVEGYKQQVRKRNKIFQQQRKSSMPKVQQQGQGSRSAQKNKLQQKKVKIEYDRFGTYDYEFKGTITCIQAQKIVKQQKIIITVPQMESKEIQGYLFGIGGKTQYYYYIKSNLIKGTVKRLSQDFDWLNNTLLRLYPYLVLPQLEPVRKDLKDPYIRRQKQIEQYLQHLADKKFLPYSYIFIDFLTISSQKMQKYKKSYDSMGFAKGVSLLKSQQGFVEVDLSNRTRQLYNSSRQFSKRTSQLHDSLAQAISKMIQSYKIAISDTYSVVDLFAQLHDAFSSISNKFPHLKKQEYNDTLVNLNNLFLGVGDNLKKITDTVQKYTNDYFRFYNGLDKNLSKVQKLIKQNQTQYIEFKNNLQKKKERVISDPSKWDLDNREIDTKKMSKQELMKMILPKDVLAQSQLRTWYAFNLKNYESELNAYLRFITKRYQKVFKNLAVQLLSNDKSYLQAITKFISDGRKTMIIEDLTISK